MRLRVAVKVETRTYRGAALYRIPALVLSRRRLLHARSRNSPAAVTKGLHYYTATYAGQVPIHPGAAALMRASMKRERRRLRHLTVKERRAVLSRPRKFGADWKASGGGDRG